MEIKEYNYGKGYFPKLFIDGKNIVDARCKCKWGKVHKNAWKEGGRLCKHIMDSIREFEMEIKKEQRKKVLKKGYYYISIDGKSFMEHRIVVENYIGRKLLKTERVHHINGIKTDNRIENLMLFSNDSEHIKFHNKIRQFGMTNPIKRQIENRWEEYGK